MNFEPQVYLCTQCGYPCENLVRKYSKSALTLQCCKNCSQIIDKYIEYDLTAVFIDILLLKISAYRHVLFNTSNKHFLKRLLGLTLLSCSYVHWVYEKHSTELSNKNSEPIFYELEWSYYIKCFHHLFNVTVFTATFLFYAYLASKSFVVVPKYFSYRHLLEGVALSYCWNLAVIPSLVWNHYATYSVLSQVGLFISSIHIFRVCVRPDYFLAVFSVASSFAMKWSASQLLSQLK